jgi:opacity protein-like surface antigen
MRKFSRLILILFLFGVSDAQTRSLDLHLSITGSLGATRDLRSVWYYNLVSPEGNTGPISPGLGFGIGAEFGPLLRVRGTMLFSSVEASFGQESSRRAYSSGFIEGNVQRMPLILWAKIISESDLSPFIRFGIGYAQTDYSQMYSNRSWLNMRFHEWDISWAVGGGLNYQTSKSTAIELFFDVWISAKDIVAQSPNGGSFGLIGNYSLCPVGLRYIFSL